MKKWLKIFLFLVGFLVLWKTISSASCVPLISSSHFHTPNINTPHVFLVIAGNRPFPQSRAQMSGSNFQPLAQSVSPEAVSWEAVSGLDPQRPGFPARPPSHFRGPPLWANAGLLPPAPHQDGGSPLVWGLLPLSSHSAGHTTLGVAANTLFSLTLMPQFTRASSSPDKTIRPAHRIPASIFFQGLACLKLFQSFLTRVLIQLIFILFFCPSIMYLGSQVMLGVKNLPANVGDIGDVGLRPGLERYLGGGHGNPVIIQYMIYFR